MLSPVADLRTTPNVATLLLDIACLDGNRWRKIVAFRNWLDLVLICAGIYPPSSGHI